MNQKAKDYIRRNTLDLESDNRMDSTGYVQYLSLIHIYTLHTGIITIGHFAFTHQVIYQVTKIIPCHLDVYKRQVSTWVM